MRSVGEVEFLNGVAAMVASDIFGARIESILGNEYSFIV